MNKRSGLLLAALASVAVGACAHHGPRYVEAHYAPGYSVHVSSGHVVHGTVRYYKPHDRHLGYRGHGRHHGYDRYGHHHYPGCGH